MLGYKYLGLFGLKIPHPAAWQMHWDDGEQEMETYSMFQDINIQFSKMLIVVRFLVLVTTMVTKVDHGNHHSNDRGNHRSNHCGYYDALWEKVYPKNRKKYEFFYQTSTWFGIYLLVELQ